jgi:nucleoside-diphosphate-sugar epimerase
MQEYYKSNSGYTVGENFGVTESQTLGLDISKSLKLLDWKPELSFEKMLYDLVDFFRRQQDGEKEIDICLRQIKEFFA